MKTIKPLAIGLAFPAVVLTVFYISQFTSTRFPFDLLTEDPLWTVGPNGENGEHPLYASGTNVMLAGWALTLGVCLFSFAATKDRFFLIIGALTAGLWVDDAFMIHEWWLGSDGTREKYVFVVWGLVAWLVVIKYRRRFAAQRPDILFVAVALLAGSLLFDQPRLHYTHWAVASLDDTCKMLGIYAWLTWVVLAGLAALRPTPTPVVEAEMVAAGE